MDTLLFRINTDDNPHVTDEALVEDCMQRLMEKWPQVTGYQYERVGNAVHILMWGDLSTPQEEA